jgi:hypothetical protein
MVLDISPQDAPALPHRLSHARDALILLRQILAALARVSAERYCGALFVDITPT